MSAKPSILPAILVGLLFAAGIAWYYRHAHASDLAGLYLAARLAGAGQIEHLYERSAQFFNIVDTGIWLDFAREAGIAPRGFTPYVYPPLWAALFAPAAEALSFRAYFVAANLVNALAITATVLIAAWRWCPALLRPLPFAGVLVAVAWARPTVDLLVLGQPQAITVLLVLVAMVASQERRPVLAGAALALAAAVKVVPGVLAIYWLTTRRRDCALWFAGFLAALALVSVALAGWPAHLAFLESVSEIGRSLVMAHNNQGLAAFIGHFEVPRAEMFEWRPFPLGAPVRAALIAGAALVLGAAITAGRRAPDGRADAAAMLAILLAATVAAPLAWTHYYVLLVIPCIVLAGTGHRAVPLAVLALTSVFLAGIATRAVREGASTLLLWPELAAGVLTLGALLALVFARARPLRTKGRTMTPEAAAPHAAAPASSLRMRSYPSTMRSRV